MRNMVLSGVLGLGLAIALWSSSGCVGQTRVAAGVRIAEPTLVYIGPGLWVVADSDDPIFFSDGSYWLYRSPYWYRTNYYGGAWEFYQPYRVPFVVRRIHSPRSYRHYRPRPGQQIRRVPRRVPPGARPVPRRRNEVVPPRRRNEVVPPRRGGHY